MLLYLMMSLCYPFNVQRHPQVTFGQNFDFKISRDNRKNSHERRIYESEDDSSLS